MAVKKVTRKKRDIRKVDKGQAHIHASFNNTIVTITDTNGATLWRLAAPARWDSRVRERALPMRRSRRAKRRRAARRNTDFVP